MFKDYDKYFMLGLPEGLHKFLKGEAKRRKITMNKLVLQAILNYQIKLIENKEGITNE